MTDYSSDRGRRRSRRYNEYGRQGEELSENTAMPSTAVRPTTILTKSLFQEKAFSQTEGVESHFTDSSNYPPESRSSTILTRETKDEVSSDSLLVQGSSTPTHLSQEASISSQMYAHTKSAPSHSSTEAVVQSRLAGGPAMNQPIKLIDDLMNWCGESSIAETLMEQCDYTVVGVIGPQGSGKSTILSWLYSSLDDNAVDRNFPFVSQSKETMELCSHQTTGIEMCITAERTFLIDSQPILSLSVLNQLVCQDRRIPADYDTAENCAEMQALQLASFMLTTCHVVLVVCDWFIDVDFLRFLKRAEMLKPSTPLPSSDIINDDHYEHFPHIVFVVNKAQREDFTASSYQTMQTMLGHMMEGSKLRFRGSLNMQGLAVHNCLNKRTVNDDINLIILPEISMAQKDKNKNLFNVLQDYCGHPPFDIIVRSFAKQLLAIPRIPLTNGLLPERNWIQYCARTWENIKKSNLFTEYKRLLP